MYESVYYAPLFISLQFTLVTHSGMYSDAGTMEKRLALPLSEARGELAFESPSQRKTHRSERTLPAPRDPSFPSASASTAGAPGLYEDEPSCALSVGDAGGGGGAGAEEEGDGERDGDERVADLVAQVLNVMPSLDVERVRRYFLGGLYTTADQLLNDALEGALKPLPSSSAPPKKQAHATSTRSANDKSQEFRKFLPKGKPRTSRTGLKLNLYILYLFECVFIAIIKNKFIVILHTNR